MLVGLIGSAACDRATEATTGPAGTVASLVPAATDLLIAMGAKDHLVAVSNYDSRDATAGLPRVGDYQQTDWEKIAGLRPALMVIQVAPSRLPAGFVQRTDSMGIRLVNVQINRLDDIFSTSLKLGEAIDEDEFARQLNLRIRSTLDEVERRVAKFPRQRVLLCRDETAVYVVGRDNFVDDLLTIAGGENVIRGDNPWPSIDPEKLVALDPDVIIQLLPDAPQQVLDRAKQTWATMAQLRAVKSGRVHVVTDWYALQPGARVGDLAETFAKLIHAP